MVLKIPPPAWLGDGGFLGRTSADGLTRYAIRCLIPSVIAVAKEAPKIRGATSVLP